MKDDQTVGERAHKYHSSGFHCAEAVLLAATESYENGNAHIPGAATAFGGGVGGSHEEMCGALSGGLIALGCLLGRDAPDEDWSKIRETAGSFRKRFLARYSTTKCNQLLEQFGPQEDMDRCKRLSGEVTQMLEELIDSLGEI